MRDYSHALICTNGHIITGSQEDDCVKANACTLCSARIISVCSNCDALIRGSYYEDKHFYLSRLNKAPAYCHNCGEPYPWTKSRLEAVQNIVDMLDELSPEQKQELVKYIPDIMVDTPRTQYATLVVGKLLSNVTGFGKDVLTQWLIDNAIPTVLMLLNLIQNA